MATGEPRGWKTEFEDTVAVAIALRAEVARLEERNAAKDAALREAEWGSGPAAGQRTCPVCIRGNERDGHEPGCKLAAALSDAQTGTAGEGWLPPEVREQAANTIRLLASLAHIPHLRLSEECEAYPCPQARAALDVLTDAPK